MQRSLFGAISSYIPTENVTPKENYYTELLVYLLQYSLNNSTRLFAEFIDLLGGKISIPQYEEIHLESQRFFLTSDNQRAIIDIAIESKSEYYLIECKVDSDLNHYTIKNNPDSSEIINQIQKYQKTLTDKPKSVYLLTKHLITQDLTNCQDFKKRIGWSDLYQTISIYQTNDPIENYLVKEITTYLKEERMSVQKVSYELINGMTSFNNLCEQIEIILEGIPYKSSFGYEWAGYYLYGKSDRAKKNVLGWLGTHYDGTRIVYQYHKKEIVSLIKQKYEKDFEYFNKPPYYYVSFIFEKEHYFCLTAEEQIDKLRKWIEFNYNRLIQLSNEK
jgi:hypothetical protein